MFNDRVNYVFHVLIVCLFSNRHTESQQSYNYTPKSPFFFEEKSCVKFYLTTKNRIIMNPFVFFLESFDRWKQQINVECIKPQIFVLF